MIKILYIAQCGKCGNYLATGVPGYPAATPNGSDSPLFTSGQEAVTNAVARGWSAYPLRCPDCVTQAKESAVNNKTAGLYIALAKALNALEEAGEEPRPSNLLDILGETGGVVYNAVTELWTVV